MRVLLLTVAGCAKTSVYNASLMHLCFRRADVVDWLLKTLSGKSGPVRACAR